MDTPSDRFHQQPAQMCSFELYRSLTDSNPTSRRFSSGSLSSHPLFSPLMHPNSASHGWGNFRQRQALFPGLLVDDDVSEEDVFGKRDFTAGGNPSSQHCPGDKGQGSALELEDWSHDFAEVKRLRMDSADRSQEEFGREGKRGRKSRALGRMNERKGGKQGNRRESREGRKRQRQELKLQLEETKGKLLELQRKVWRVYGGEIDDENRCEEEQDNRAINLDEVAEMFSDGDDPLISGGSSPPRCSSKKNNESNQNGNAGIFPETSMDLELNGDQVWLGCSLIRGEWESTEGGQKFAQALKQELASVVAQVIDKVVRLYAETDHSFVTSTTMAQETSMALDLNTNSGPKPDRVAHVAEQVEALPLISKSSQEKRAPIVQSGPKDLLIPQANPSLAPLPQPPLSVLLPPRRKEHFLPSYPPDNPVSLPILHYTMQNLFARSLSSLPLHKDCLSEPFMEFHSHNSAFPPLPLLGQLDPSQMDRLREGGMRGGGAGLVDGGDAALYLAAGSSQEGLSPCHLKKAKLMFFYARYPSSSTLKTYFPDVKFNRCVTSQLIKWFSNFREFFYIQMERFARQAAREGLTSARERVLRLGRDTELYRILNMHYNKSNDYQVPERFVEVAELALREFFSAIQSSRDTDPCWKKAIYKIICKLDSPVPDSFRLPGCPTDTYRMG
ncbi:prospero homeobox protein 1-like [Xyrauchen texanus]|uniref:prospero homeobox protein 1-like n=1 Tax=Xyrauchen texanus TaxID=154827 RepID=UPI002242618F|nr:prospero homeobox protein 1-like [Xyrauchen texanus]XP_052009299.1 prospero homeobox protein 1-like [Xyrauchen texanus]XP_052009307.1 prospero homeobox protein 1-like [Xyrauchen texanus]XP_052009314.1 prospero homeobox protein 1-like [Xyrauchen texanus]XP_052009324.1 prospero homeobox protein 1-like [Xyrauchen texanus]